MSYGKESSFESMWESATDLGNSNRSEALAALSEALWERAKHEESIQVGYEVLADLNSNFADTEVVRHTFDLACKLTNAERYKESSELIDSTLNRPGFCFDSIGLGFLYWHQEENLQYVGTLPERIATVEKAVECFKEANDELKGKIHSVLGLLLAQCDLFERAISEFIQAIDLLESEGEPKLVGEAKLALAEALLNSGHFQMAQKYAEDCRSIFDFLGENLLSQKTICLQARIASAQGRDEEAEELFDQAAQQRSDKDEKGVAAIAYFYKAKHWKKIGNSLGASILFQEMVPILRSLGENEFANQAEIEN